MSKALLPLLVLAVICVNGSAAISCYTRTSNIAYTNGSVTSCLSTDTSCYSYTYANTQFAGCGGCPAGTTNAYACTTCSTTDYCNVQSTSTITCFVPTGFTSSYSSISAPATICYGISKCYRYSTTYGGVTLWYGGCGACNSYYPNCKDCSTEYCNNKSNLSASGSVKVAIAGVLMLALMKLGL